MSQRKTYHYVGLVGWNELFFSNRDVVVCDSRSLLIVARLFGFRLKYEPGSSAVSKIDVNDKKNVYLTPFELPQYPFDQQFVLPVLTDPAVLPIDLVNWLQARRMLSNIFIGISSPKQNIFAASLAKQFDVDIHCLGAALAEVGTNKFRVIKLLSGSGLEWSYRAIQSPSRFLKKVTGIAGSLFCLTRDNSSRKKFRKFLLSIESSRR